VGKNLLATMSAFAQHHAAEGKVVIDSRDKPTSARFKGLLRTPGTVCYVVKNIQLICLTVVATG
jgi:hypothetical protein